MPPDPNREPSFAERLDSVASSAINGRLVSLQPGQEISIGYQKSNTDLDLQNIGYRLHPYIRNMQARTVYISCAVSSDGYIYYSLKCAGGSVRAYEENSDSPALGGATAKPGDSYTFDFEGYDLQLNFPETFSRHNEENKQILESYQDVLSEKEKGARHSAIKALLDQLTTEMFRENIFKIQNEILNLLPKNVGGVNIQNNQPQMRIGTQSTIVWTNEDIQTYLDSLLKSGQPTVEITRQIPQANEVVTPNLSLLEYVEALVKHYPDNQTLIHQALIDTVTRLQRDGKI